ncbi:hypothetical protein AAF143_17600 [Cyanobium sp. ATX-6F1]
MKQPIWDAAPPRGASDGCARGRPTPGGLLTTREAVAEALRALKLAATHPSVTRQVLGHLGAGYGRLAVTAAIEALRDEERADDPTALTR